MPKLVTHRAGSVLALVLALCPALACAQPVYRCAADGRVTFQDTECPGAESVDPLALEPLPAGPVPVAVKDLVERYEARQRGAPPPRTSRTARRNARADNRPAYRCIAADGQASYSNQPCRAPRGRKGEPSPRVEQQLVTQREACEGRHAALDPYEREKRGPPDCGPR